MNIGCMDGFGCGTSAGCGRCPCRAAAAARLGELGERYEPQVLQGVPTPATPFTPTPGQARARVEHLKGKIAERLSWFTPEARAAMTEARARAAQEGLDPASVRFTRRVEGVHHDGRLRQLTDGMIYAPTKDGRIRVLNVFETKARSNLRDVAFRAQRDLGQIANDFERMRQLPMKVDGRVLQPRNVLVSRNRTAWTVFSPKGVTPTPAHDAEIRRSSGFAMRHVELPVTTTQLQQRATVLARKLGPRPPRRR